MTKAITINDINISLLILEGSIIDLPDGRCLFRIGTWYYINTTVYLEL